MRHEEPFIYQKERQHGPFGIPSKVVGQRQRLTCTIHKVTLAAYQDDGWVEGTADIWFDPTSTKAS